MRILLTFILSLSIYICQGQIKEQLIDSIILVNRHDSDCVFYDGSKSPQYQRFQRLKTVLSKNELIELSKHRNPIIRTYASIEIIQSSEECMDTAIQVFSYSLENDISIESNEGCFSHGLELTSSIIYHSYRNKIVNETLYSSVKARTEMGLGIKKRLAADSILKRLDSIIIYSEKEAHWMLYGRAFENRKYPRNYLTRIEELAFTENNSYAIEYLKKHHKKEYSKLIKN